MKKMFVGIFALVLCLSSFKGMAQDENQINAFVKMHNSIVSLMNTVLDKTKEMNPNDKNAFFNECQNYIDKLKNEKELESNAEYLYNLSTTLGFKDYDNLSDDLSIFFKNKEAFFNSVNLKNPTDTELEVIYHKCANAARGRNNENPTPTKGSGNDVLMQAPLDGGSYVGGCKNPMGFFGCTVIVTLDFVKCCEGCGVVLGVVPPAAAACATGCLLRSLFAEIACHKTFCE